MGFARGQRGIMRRLPRECREWPCITQLIYARIARILVGDVDRSIFLFVCTDIFLAGVGKKKLALRKLRIPAAFATRHLIGRLDSP
jgi:hypothetical protein